jgi:hypothetical protein
MDTETKDQPAAVASATTPAALSSSALLGAGYHGSDGAVCCALCHAECEWEQCTCDDGYTAPGELHEEDPLWYDEGDIEPCQECNARGGWWVCPTRDCCKFPISRIISAPNDKLCHGQGEGKL